MGSPNEYRFESHIEKGLNESGYTSIHFEKYDRDLCLIPSEVLEFVRSSQPNEWDELINQYGSEVQERVLGRISKEIERRGITDVLRKGIKDRGVHLDLCYFEPKSGLNEEHKRLYGLNHFSVVRQLHYSKLNENSIDMGLFLNGLPVVTMELKNQLTGQSVNHSKKQYQRDRDPKEPLLRFQRCIVHFCVDNDEVWMTTRLSGDKTRFLPYNKDIKNPPNPNGYKSHYLWDDILTPPSLLDIIENFVHLSIEKDKEWNDKTKRVEETTSKVLIFPRYHQLDVIRSLRREVIKEGVGHNYLIQHTTGSGKSYSIGWLSHLLTSLYRSPTDTNRIFDTIIVITDRKVLDSQLQYTIQQLGQIKGVVNPVDHSSKQLLEFLEKGKDIIITTIQKFPVISERISSLNGHSFGVIIDEVHSSQSGENSKHLKKSISQGEVELDEDGEPKDWTLEDEIREEIRSRGKQSHVSFFGFTGTPKPKTLELFGRKGGDGQFHPFHSYTMKQSIHEGFTLDVLKNYTQYKRYFRLTQHGEDVELPEDKVTKEIFNLVDSDKETISRKVSIILDHFTLKTVKTIGGRGRGMVVVRSRYHCVLFFHEMKRQMKERGLHFSCLTGFSGTIKYGGREVTETILNTENGLKHNISIPDGLKDPHYRVLIVSNKFQTGFDEPLLQSMYVDKKLGGVQCVQTLSRLNRTKNGKTETFVLDFVNDPEKVVESFGDYYESTYLEGETDPNKLYDLQTKIRGFYLIQKEDIDEFVTEFYKSGSTDERLHPPLDRVVNRWEELPEEEREEFRSTIQSFVRLYGYVSQIISFEDVDLEKEFVFLKYLNKKLPKRESERIDITEIVDLDSLRIQKISEGSLELEGGGGGLPPGGEVGQSGLKESQLDLLSDIIKRVNDLYGVNLESEEVQKIKDVIFDDESLRQVMTSDNSDRTKKDKFNQILGKVLISRVNDSLDFYKKMEKPEVRKYVSDSMYRYYTSHSG